MKTKTIFKTLVMLLAIITIFSCSSDDDDGEANQSTSDTYLRAQIDGVDFEVQEDFFFAVTSNISGISSTIMGASNEDESMGITLGLANVDSTGTYTFLTGLENEEEISNSSYVSSIIYFEDDKSWFASVILGSVSATVTITELDESFIIGTFSFIGFDIESQTEKTITNGEFKFKRLNT